VSVDTGTDFWRETGYGYVRDSGHVYGEVLAGDLDVSVRVRCTLGVQYDQAGIMLRADERTWLKTGMEFFEGRPRLSTVLTLGRSSWMVTDLPAGTDEIVLRVSRRGDAVEVRYVLGDAQPELAALAFLPPGREVLAGVMGAAPEGPGFRVTFQDLRITEPDWSAPADGAMTWQDDQPSWAGSDTPGWAQPEDEPGWAAPEAREEITDRPGGAAGDDESSWPLPAVAEDGPGWAAPEGGEGAADWPVAADAAEEPGWAAPAAEDAGQAPMPDRVPAGEPSPGGPGGPESAASDPARPDVAVTDADGPGQALPGPAGRAPGAEPARDEPGRPGPPGPEAGNRGSGPAGWAPEADRDAAADWDLLAAGAQADPAEKWVAQSDADVADQWPGPPTRTAARSAPPARDATPGPAIDHPADDAQTDPGLATGRLAEDAATLPDQAEASTKPDPAAAAGEGTAEDGAPGDSAPEDSAARDGAAGNSAPEDGAAGDSAAEPGPVKRKPSGRESRRARSKRAAAEPPPEPDAADEWISLLTADPAEE
jgi:regulation of enolase protein 1 (concanavalin A-like superfamily)